MECNVDCNNPYYLTSATKQTGEQVLAGQMVTSFVCLLNGALWLQESRTLGWTYDGY